MHKSKLFEQLNALDPADFKKFGEIVHSPFFNKNKKLKDLFEYISRYYPELDHPDLNKQAAYPIVFPNEPFDDRKLRAMMSMLSKLVEELLVQQQLDKKQPMRGRLLLDGYFDIGLEKHYKAKLKQSYQSIDQLAYRDVEYYFNQYQLEERHYNYAVSKKDRTIGQSLTKLINDLDVYYIANRLKFSCEELNRKSIMGEEYDLQFLEVLLDFVEGSEILEVPVVNIYYEILQTFLEPDNERHFERLLKLLEQHVHEFPQSENKVMYGYAMNYCIKKINTGQSEYLEQIFKLYKLLLEFDIIYEGQYISQWDYKNIVTVGLRLNEIDWTEWFIHEYQPKLSQDVRENAFKYNLANLNYFKGDFKETMLLLREVEFTDMSYELSSKTMLLKSYYELGEYAALFPHADSFKLFLRRNKKISDYQKTIYKNLIRYIVKLSKLKSSFRNIPPRLIKEITESTQIADKTWLMNKVEKENVGR